MASHYIVITRPQILEGIADDMAVKRERDHLKAVADGFRTAYTT